MKRHHAITLAALLASGGAWAQPASAPGHAAHHAASATPDNAAPETEGEVRRIDKANGKLTLRHGPIRNLDMPGMTMVFRVADPRWLDALHEGDKVRFSAENVGGALVVTAIEPSR